jgi:predicted secreted protein
LEKQNANRRSRRFKAARNPKTVAPERAESVVETDLSSLKRMIAQLDDIWDLQVMNYSDRSADSCSGDGHFVAMVHLKLVSALAAFDAEYVVAKAAIDRRLELALRLSGISKAELKRIVRLRH